MKKFLFFALFLILCKFSFSQQDTVYYYFSKDAKEVSSDSAFYYSKLYKYDNHWCGRDYYKKGNILKSEGNYAEKDGKTPVGSVKNYTDNGALDNIVEYENRKVLSKTYFYKNGNRKSSITYKDKAPEQRGWDENGNEVRNYVVEREASFKNGLEGWKKYLEKTLNANAAADANAPAGTYEVKVQFIITKEGYVSKVKAMSVPAACKPCGGEAISAISNSAPWQPAIQNNEPVIYQAIQSVIFQVAERGKKSRKG